MSSTKKKIREAFRNAVFRRDNNRCRICGRESSELDAHHITDRDVMPNGGYVKENGISLCPPDHLKAEKFHQTQGLDWYDGMHPDDLYKLIGSSKEKAYAASERLNQRNFF